MGQREKLLDKILRGTSDANINFDDLRRLLKALGFGERIRGDHHIFTRAGVAEILNLQPKGAQAKAYQVKQVRFVILRMDLRINSPRKTMTRYEIIIYWSDEDDSFIAEVPELPGCAADGATYKEALANAEVVIQEWIETAKELNRPIPEPKGRLVFA